jgi:hypothetical protein
MLSMLSSAPNVSLIHNFQIVDECLFSEQTLAQNFQPYLPSPVGLWPLSRSTGTTEVTASKIPGNESWIAYDTLVTPGKYEEYSFDLYN